MNLLAELRCERCEGDLRAVNVGKIIAGREGNVMFECEECKFPILVTVSVRPAYADLNTDLVPHRKIAVCGTEAGYTRHRRDGTYICEWCASAHREGNARRAKRNKVSA